MKRIKTKQLLLKNERESKLKKKNVVEGVVFGLIFVIQRSFE